MSYNPGDRTNVCVDHRSLVLAFSKVLEQAETADEILDVLSDTVLCGKESLFAHFPFGAMNCAIVEDPQAWMREILRVVINAGFNRRRGRSRVMRRPPTPAPGNMYFGPDEGLLTVLCATSSGIVICVPLIDKKWNFGSLVAYAAADFANFVAYEARGQTEEANPQTQEADQSKEVGDSSASQVSTD